MLNADVVVESLLVVTVDNVVVVKATKKDVLINSDFQHFMDMKYVGG